MAAINLIHLNQVVDKYKKSLQDEGRLHKPIMKSSPKIEYTKVVKPTGRSVIPIYKKPFYFRANDAKWINRKLYDFVEGKLEKKYKAYLLESVSEALRRFSVVIHHISCCETANTNLQLAILENELADDGIVHTHYDFLDLYKLYLDSKMMFRPIDARWTVTSVYKYIHARLAPKFKFLKIFRAVEFVERLYAFSKAKHIHLSDLNLILREMEKLKIVESPHDFIKFFTYYMPKAIYQKVISTKAIVLPVAESDADTDSSDNDEY